MRNLDPDSEENQRQTLDNQRAVFAAKMQAAQRAYDNEEPESEHVCFHRWVVVREAKDGTRFIRCSKCGKDEEV
jgi:hypothetical protein